MYSTSLSLIMLIIGITLLILYRYTGCLLRKQKTETTSSLHKYSVMKRNRSFPENRCDIEIIEKDKDKTIAKNQLLSDHAEVTLEKKSEKVFVEKVSFQTKRLLGLCQFWEDTINNNTLKDNYKDEYEEINGELAAVVGKTRLLIDGRFRQFKSLVNDFQDIKALRDNAKIRRITLQDLQGFWELIYLQIEDLDRRFDTLNKLYTKVHKE